MDVEAFPSKVDPWLGVIIAIVPLVGVMSFVALALTGDTSAMLAGGLSMLGMFAIIPAFVYPLRYELRDDALVIRFGILRSRVPYDRIRAVTPTRTLVGSPALSLDRLHVQAGSALGPNISPADKQGFLQALARRAPHLRLMGDRLVSG
jgi:uncharacterized membrane protein YdbT with pleckstrin-like domain